MEVHAGPSQYDDGGDEEEDREVGALGFADCDDGGNHGDLNHDDGLQAEEMVVRGSLAKEELEQHYSVY